MEPRKSHDQRNKGMVRLFAFVLLVALSGFASAASAVYSLPADLSVLWQGNVGVQGDIPLRTTIYRPFPLPVATILQP